MTEWDLLQGEVDHDLSILTKFLVVDWLFLFEGSNLPPQDEVPTISPGKWPGQIRSGILPDVADHFSIIATQPHSEPRRD